MAKTKYNAEGVKFYGGACPDVEINYGRHIVAAVTVIEFEIAYEKAILELREIKRQKKEGFKLEDAIAKVAKYRSALNDWDRFL